MRANDNRSAPISKESLIRLVLYRGVLQFGIGAALLFTILAVIRGDTEWTQHAIRALVAFPLFGAFCGVAIWTFAKLQTRKSSRSTNGG